MPSHDTRSGGNFRGFTPSVKNACSMPWYSLAEEASTLLLEFTSGRMRPRRAIPSMRSSMVCRSTNRVSRLRETRNDDPSSS